MGSQVATAAGKVAGRQVEPGVHAFLGIPYAKPPVGPRRYLAPVPVDRWDGVRDAREYGPTAPQPDQEFTLIPEPVVRGDDFLNLNVFTPDLSDAKLPVLVWIHGGGFLAGCNRSPWYRGESFARDGVVLVAINYRLGAEGFLTLHDAPSNRGALDWIAALEWVHDNIASFGGDPSRVTIAGQSAGGAACAALLAIPRAQGLFRQAIMMSGAGHMAVAPEAARATAAWFASELKIEPTRGAFAQVPVDDVIAVQARLNSLAARGDAVSIAKQFAGGLLPFAPVPDGELLDRTPIEEIAAGAGSPVPVLVGNTSQEFNLTEAIAAGSIDEATLLAALGALGLTESRARAWLAESGRQSNGALFGQALTDRTFRIPAIRVAEARANAEARTYAYEFRWPSPGLGGQLGAGHCVDIPFVFDLLHAEGVAAVAGDDPPQQLADAMHRAWVSFVNSGDPGWEAYEPARRVTMLFDSVSEAVDDPISVTRAIWDGVL